MVQIFIKETEKNRKYVREISNLDKSIKCDVFNKWEIKAIVKQLIESYEYEVYGTLLIDYIFELNPLTQVFLDFDTRQA